MTLDISARNRQELPDRDWRLPLEADHEHGIVTRGCWDRLPRLISYKAGVGLRIGGEAFLCFRCGPDGGVYHPDGHTIEHVLNLAKELDTIRAPWFEGGAA